MLPKRLAAVLGATRGQGASVVDSLLKSGQYIVRGVTAGSLDSPGADRLRERGIELVGVDLDDPSTLPSAFATAQVVFAVTTMRDGDMQREIRQGRNIVDAVSAVTTLEHFVWSTLPSAIKKSKGTIAVPHMDGKAEVDEYLLTSHPTLAQKTTFYWGGYYAENATYPSFRPNFVPDMEKHVWIQAVKADTIVPMVGDHTTNTGIIVRKIFDDPQQCLPAGYVLGVVDWVRHGAYLQAWATILSYKQGDIVDPVYVSSNVDTINHIWPGSGGEFGQMLKYSEVYGEEAWTKDGVRLLTITDLELKTGDGEGELVNTSEALKRLGEKLGLLDSTSQVVT